MRIIRIMGLVAAVLLMGAVSAGETVQAARVTVDIEQQPLRDALGLFATQTGLQILRRDEDVSLDGLMAPRVVGSYTPGDALGRLLASTSLVYEFINDRTVRISRQPAPAGQKSGHAVGSNGMQVALTKVAVAAAGAEVDKAGADASQPEAARGIPEMLVKGRRSLNADIRRTEDDVQPYVVFEAAEIERSAATNIEEFLKTRLPMNAVQQTNSQSVGGQYGNQSSIDLRGLGSDQTLVLVNGRRQPSISGVISFGEFNQPDVNGIPLSAVERIEVLPSTASGIYGGGATGGVVNIILRQDYAGAELKATYENAFDSDVARRRIDANAGFSLANGRTNVLLAASYVSSNQLLIGDREFTRRGQALMLKNDPAAFYGSRNPVRGYTTNIRSSNGADLVLDDSTVLDEAVTHVPVGYAGLGSDGVAPLLANLGEYNFDLPQTTFGARRSLINGPESQSAMINLRQVFTDRLEGFLDVSHRSSESRSLASTGPLVAVIDDAAPNNPFITDIRVSFPTLITPPASTSKSTTVGIAGGLIARLPGEWMAQTEYGWSRSRFKNVGTELFTDALLDDIRDGTLDVLRDLNAYPIDYSDYFLPSPNRFQGPFDTVLKNITVRVAGPVFDLPAGPVTLSALYDYRDENIPTAFREEMDDEGDVTITYYPTRDQVVRGMYVEAQVPLISAANARAGVRALDLQASFRRDDYRTESVAINSRTVPSRDPMDIPVLDRGVNRVTSSSYTFGLRYQPLEDVMLRMSYASGFLPPGLSEIVPGTFNSYIYLADPMRDDVPGLVGPIPVVIGGNSNLRPELSDSWSAGIVFTPARLPGLRLSLDYSQIEKTDEIAGLSDQDLVNLEAQIPGRVIRGPKDPGDPADWAGPIIGFDRTLVNIAYARLEAFDMQLDYSFETRDSGVFRFFVLGSHQPTFERRVLADSELYDSVGFNGGPSKWRGNGGIRWERGDWAAGWSTQYFDRYRVYAVLSPQSSIDQAVQRQGAGHIPAQIYHDLFFSYRFDERFGFARGLLSGTDLMVNIQNVLDTEPPILATTGFTGYSTFADPRLRRYSVSLRRRF